MAAQSFTIPDFNFPLIFYFSFRIMTHKFRLIIFGFWGIDFFLQSLHSLITSLDDLDACCLFRFSFFFRKIFSCLSARSCCRSFSSWYFTQFTSIVAKKCLKCSSVFWFVLFMNPLSVDYAKNAVISRLLNLIWQLGALKFSSLWLREKEEIVKVVRKWFELKFPPNFGEKKGASSNPLSTYQRNIHFHYSRFIV